jgi:DHA2 family multidrug resistance protein-like MFS transporter
MAAGLALAGIGFLMLTQVTGETKVEYVVAASVVMSLGLAPVFTLATDMMVGTAPPERAGAASAISETCAEFGGAMGIAVLGSIGAAIYRSAMTGNIPAGLSAADANTAHSTLGGAVDVSRSLSPETAQALLSTARDAFAQSMQLTAVIGALAVAVMAIMVTTVLRNVGSDHEEEEEEEGSKNFVLCEAD